jgi:hypothetical protein
MGNAILHSGDTPSDIRHFQCGPDEYTWRSGSAVLGVVRKKGRVPDPLWALVNRDRSMVLAAQMEQSVALVEQALLGSDRG